MALQSKGAKVSENKITEAEFRQELTGNDIK